VKKRVESPRGWPKNRVSGEGPPASGGRAAAVAKRGLLESGKG